MPGWSGRSPTPAPCASTRSRGRQGQNGKNGGHGPTSAGNGHFIGRQRKKLWSVQERAQSQEGAGQPGRSWTVLGRRFCFPTPQGVVAGAQKTGVTQDTFPQPLRQHFFWPEHWLSTWHWSRQRPSGVKGKSTLGQVPGFSLGIWQTLAQPARQHLRFSGHFLSELHSRVQFRSSCSFGHTPAFLYAVSGRGGRGQIDSGGPKPGPQRMPPASCSQDPESQASRNSQSPALGNPRPP